MIDAASIRDPLEDRRSQYSFDVAAILGPSGKTVIAATPGAENYQSVIDAVAGESVLFSGEGKPAARNDFDLVLANGRTRASVRPCSARHQPAFW